MNKKVLQINTVGNSGSTGRIAEQIGITAIKGGWESYIACGRKAFPSKSNIIHIGYEWNRYPNVLWTRIFDTDSPLSKFYTLKFIDRIIQISPDIIHLHNLHGYYLHVPTLLKFLIKYNRPVIWTLHDCWAFTGHCCHFDLIGCNKWKASCGKCPQKRKYPASYFFDNSHNNLIKRIALVSKIENLTFVTVSRWLEGLLCQSHFKSKNVRVIKNGIDTELFFPDPIRQSNQLSQKNALFVSNVWNETKGIQHIPEIAKILKDFKCTVVGVSRKQKQVLESLGMIAFERTESIVKLRQLYSSADVFINPTMQDTLSNVNIEAMACGTEVATFNSCGARETVENSSCGISVQRGDVESLCAAARFLSARKSKDSVMRCVDFVRKNFSAKEAFQHYVDLYSEYI